MATEVSEYTPHTTTTVSHVVVLGLRHAHSFFEGELPHSFSQFEFTLSIGLGGFSVFTYLCAMFFMLSKCVNGHIEASEAHINQLKHIMAFHQVPKRLQAQAIEYMEQYSTDAESNDREVMRMLCPSLAKDIQVELMQDTVARIPVFIGCNKNFIKALTDALEMLALPAHCTLFSAGDEGDAMYIIQTGVLDVIIGSTKVRELRKHDFVGELSLFSDRPRSATVVTTTYCTLYQLSRFHTEKVLEGYPMFIEIIRQAVQDILIRTEQKQSVPAAVSLSTVEDGGTGLSMITRLRRPSSLFASFSGGGNHRKRSLFAPRSASVAPNQTQQSTISPVDTQADDSSRRMTSSQKASLKKLVQLVPKLTTIRSAKVSIGYPAVNDQYSRQLADVKENVWWARVLLQDSSRRDSKVRLWWLVIFQVNLIYNWVFIPFQLAYPVMDIDAWYIDVLNTITDNVLVADIYLNFNLSYVQSQAQLDALVGISARNFCGIFSSCSHTQLLVRHGFDTQSYEFQDF